jgi:hypothetical protein
MDSYKLDKKVFSVSIDFVEYISRENLVALSVALL